VSRSNVDKEKLPEYKDPRKQEYKMWKYACTLLLMGCPVEPKDVQTPNEGGSDPGQMGGNGNQQPGGNQQGGQGQGGQKGQVTPPIPGGDQAGGQGSGTQGGMGANEGEPSEMQAELGVPPTGQPSMSATPPNTPQDVIPMYSSAPSFAELIGSDGDSITLNINVSGAETYNMEFIVSQSMSGRVQPKVLHMEKSLEAKASLQVPKDYKDPVWLVISSDLTGDGPSEDDMIGGTEAAIEFGDEDINLDINLTQDAMWMEKLPWYSKADAEEPGGGL
jgi:hypothetical protein